MRRSADRRRASRSALAFIAASEPSSTSSPSILRGPSLAGSNTRSLTALAPRLFANVPSVSAHSLTNTRYSSFDSFGSWNSCGAPCQSTTQTAYLPFASTRRTCDRGSSTVVSSRSNMSARNIANLR